MKKEPKIRLAGAGVLAALALGIVALGQPSTTQKWMRIAPVKEPLLASRAVQIHPGELLASLGDDKLNVVMVDVRSEADFNLFHVHGAQRVPLAQVESIVPALLAQPANNLVVVLMSNDETAATEAWKVLAANSAPNIYILEGGVNNWIAVFNQADPSIHPLAASPGDDSLRYTFDAALGDRYASADPSPHEWKLEYTPKIKLQLQRSRSGGGCG